MEIEKKPGNWDFQLLSIHKLYLEIYEKFWKYGKIMEFCYCGKVGTLRIVTVSRLELVAYVGLSQTFYSTKTR